jgi:hypothetical protein
MARPQCDTPPVYTIGKEETILSCLVMENNQDVEAARSILITRQVQLVTTHTRLLWGWRCAIFIHARSNCEKFIHEVKGYKIIPDNQAGPAGYHTYPAVVRMEMRCFHPCKEQLWKVHLRGEGFKIALGQWEARVDGNW